VNIPKGVTGKVRIYSIPVGFGRVRSQITATHLGEAMGLQTLQHFDVDFRSDFLGFTDTIPNVIQLKIRKLHWLRAVIALKPARSAN
jgi:hypothetical protein